MGAAMLGGAAMAGRASQRASYREQQEAPPEQPEPEQQQPAPAAPAPPAPAEADVESGSSDLVAQLKQLGELKQSGVLSDEEFEAAKQKLLAS